jgi:hypothetical protein
MGTKSRETIYGGSIRAAAERATGAARKKGSQQIRRPLRLQKMQDDGPTVVEQPIQFFRLDGAASTKSQERGAVQHLREIEGRPRSFVKNRTNGDARVGSNPAFNTSAVSSPEPCRRGLAFADLRRRKKPRAGPGGVRRGFLPNRPPRCGKASHGRNWRGKEIPQPAPVFDPDQGVGWLTAPSPPPSANPTFECLDDVAVVVRGQITSLVCASFRRCAAAE